MGSACFYMIITGDYERFQNWNKFSRKNFSYSTGVPFFSSEYYKWKRNKSMQN